ncbi:MAG: MBL fold metallo-hydrolase [Gemmatimonadales bacterium]
MLTIRSHGAVSALEMVSRSGRITGYRVAAYLHRGFLIDTGIARARSEVAAWLDGHPVRGALVTHWHEDHAGNLALVIGRGIPVAISADTLARHRALPRVPLYRWLTWGHPAPVAPDPVPLDNHPFEFVDAPGHSPDHRVVWDAADGFVFAGDLFLGVKAAVEHHDADPVAMVASLKRVIALEPAEVFCAHRGRLRIRSAYSERRPAWLEDVIGQIREALAA